MEVQEVFAKNHASKKQCSKCSYYVEKYYDDYTLRHFGYGKVDIRPACKFNGNYSFVSHNPARLCRHYDPIDTNELLLKCDYRKGAHQFRYGGIIKVS